MNINYKEYQTDFFSQVEGKGAEPVRPRYMAAQISLSLENLVILAIAAIMVVIFSFSVGIERGRRAALVSPDPSVSDGASMTATSTSKVNKALEKDDAKKLQADVPKMKPVTGASQAVAKAEPKAGTKSSAVSKAPVSGAFTVQVASYKTQKPAQREADKLKEKGFKNVYVLPKGAYTIVCVGNFQSKADASDVQRQLKSRYQDFVVRRL